MYDNGKNIQFEIVTPERTVLKEQILQVTVPTRDGEITVLPKHMPLVSMLKPGVIELKTVDGEVKLMSVSGGFIEVLRNKVVILADTAERAEEIDIARAEEARVRAEKTMREATHLDQEQFAAVSAVVAKELARTRAANKWKRLRGGQK
ncbi:ATP synthase F1 subunit epsilon [Candidatus Falkowbacteria bacterium RIFOXYB2_FULL_47_14]|uniref:ATP synthase epsilon chain n=1 Tax=Candidatus Falkowbacteria bacterium RIFOXYA2_FULL_47_19 TaxID=1797994 RepID=A0A1F5SLC7_9BACT|nr:MAG: ATP synthase F1 subunit epsilon [Candidatus Falkowbacteria bacterium RIFOXYA2_FULL_47_19]OGF35376.1 MAG: ATP synthase F1 subunit epsilon [Candidatus Falkowbacteria bacterium RIFOXYC2_FULL_46_15]OGF43103.1 MAG: ATP synthase F1 subunit epsilon [Candidatus Falkowbacteria bacterium RIFOXYB2_FULL_47_14]